MGSIYIIRTYWYDCQVQAENSTRRRGRPKAGEHEERRQRVLDAAMAQLVEHGYEKVTMLGVAREAGASKETLYNWFGNREGLFAALITANADNAAANVSRALESEADPVETLTGFATGLLMLLTAPESVALNRAAMTSPDLARILLDGGRHRVGPIVERYLGALIDAGVLAANDVSEAFETLYGLVIRDTQIRVLLGEEPPPPASAPKIAADAVQRFLMIYRP